MAPATAMSAVVAGLIVLASVAHVADAHGGHLHEWPGTPVGRNYNRVAAASCNKWVQAKPSTPAKSLVDADAAALPTNATGTATIWAYQYKNCSHPVSAGLDLYVNLTDAKGKPLGGMSTNGRVHTDTCASGGGDIFFFNNSATPLENDENMLWYHNFTVPSTNGSIRGNGANDGDIRTSGPKAIKSIIISTFKGDVPLVCCDLVVGGPPATNWTAELDGEGVKCDADGNPITGTEGTETTTDTAAAGGTGAATSGAAPAASPAPAAAAKSGAAVRMASSLLLAAPLVVLAVLAC